ncbi:MAG: phytanoyl-CoA dioxygenase family protein [Thiohalomonadales bacterium]
MKITNATGIKSQMREQGYVIVRNVFQESEIATIRKEFDRLKEEALQYKGVWRDQNVVYMVREHPEKGYHVRFIHWAPYISPLLDQIRIDKRYLTICSPLISNDVKQIQSQTSWKTPGCADTYYSFHQDYRFRRPDSAFRNIGTSNLNTMLAVDPHTKENGCLQVYPGSHKMGPLDLPQDNSIMNMGYQQDVLTAAGIDASNLVDIELEPGDVALWYSYVIHGSGPNNSSSDRRGFLNSYNKAQDTDRGEWAFKNGVPCPLSGEPVLINYGAIYDDEDPHYVEGTLYPSRTLQEKNGN